MSISVKDYLSNNVWPVLTQVRNEQELDKAIDIITSLQDLIYQQELEIREYFNRSKEK